MSSSESDGAYAVTMRVEVVEKLPGDAVAMIAGEKETEEVTIWISSSFDRWKCARFAGAAMTAFLLADDLPSRVLFGLGGGG